MKRELSVIQPSIRKNIHRITRIYNCDVYYAPETGYLNNIPADIVVISTILKTIVIIECKDGRDRGVAVQTLGYKDSFQKLYSDFNIYTIIVNTDSKDLKSFDRSREIDQFFLFSQITNKEFKLINISSQEELGPFSISKKEKIDDTLLGYELDPKIHNIRLRPSLRPELENNLSEADLGIRVDWLNPNKTLHEFLTGKKYKFGIEKITKENSIGDMNLMAGSIKNLTKIIANFPYINGLERKMALHYCKNMGENCELWSIEPVAHYFSPFINLRTIDFQNNEKLNLPYIQDIYFSFEMYKSFGIIKQPLGFVHYVKHPTSKITFYNLDDDSPGITRNRSSYQYIINDRDCEDLILKIWKYKEKVESTTKDFLTSLGGFSTRGKNPIEFPFKKWSKYLGKCHIPYKYEYLQISDKPLSKDAAKKGGKSEYDIWRPIPEDREQDVINCINHPLTKFLHKLHYFSGAGRVYGQIPITVPDGLFSDGELQLMSSDDFSITHPDFRFSRK